jgi:hypothetical protein
LRNIDDPRLRRHLADVLTTDYSDVGLATMQTRYRTDMRLVIPNDIQNEIRTHCGDRLVRNAADQNIFVLPADCRLALDPSRVAAAARLLRAKFSRKRALHLGSVNGCLQNIDIIEIPMRTLERDLDKRS